jgi:hypothetical protein
MPIYVFEDPETGETVEVIQGMNDDHEHVDDKGIKWNRVWCASELNTDGQIDPWNSNDFVNKTKGDSGNIGDLLDRSAELSDQRAKDHGGVDPVKEKFYKDYSKNRGGSEHPDKSKKKSWENKNWRVDYD